MSVAELLQLYTPLAGLLALAFWVGALGQKVADLKAVVEDLKADSTVEGSPAVVRLQEQVKNLTSAVEKLTRVYDGTQRQLANLMQKTGPIQGMNP